MQMHIPHSLVVLVVSLGIFAQGKPTGLPQIGCTEQINVPIEVVRTCPQPEIISIKTVYRTVKEIIPDCGCTDDFTDFANVQLIADTACRNGLVFSSNLKTRKRGIFEPSPSCQSFSIVENPQEALRRRGESGGLSDLIHSRFDSYKEGFTHNLNQNINNNENTNEDDSQGGRGFGGYKKMKRDPHGWGGYGGFRGGRFDDGAFDNNDNQNINQNVNANQNLMANLGKFNGFFGGREGRGDGGYGGYGGYGYGGYGDGGYDGGVGRVGEAAFRNFGGLGFGNNDNTDFNVNNNVAFEDDGFFKDKRDLRKRHFRFRNGGDLDDSDNQNINQNINNNQNLNADFFGGIFGGGGGGGGDDDIVDRGFGFFPGYIGDCGGYGGYGGWGCGGYGGGFGGYGGGYGGYGGFRDFDGYRGFGGFSDDDVIKKSMNENSNNNPSVNVEAFGNRFGGGFDGDGFRKVKRSPCTSGACDESFHSHSKGENVNYNSNINHNVNTNVNSGEEAIRYETIVEKVPYIEKVPIVETVYKPTVEYQTTKYVETVPVIEEVYEPIRVVEQVKPAPVPVCTAPACTVQVAKPAPVVEVITPVTVEIQPVIEYAAVFYEAPGCGVPNYPSYSYGSCPN